MVPIASRGIEGASSTQWGLYNVPSFPPCPPLSLLCPLSLCSRGTCRNASLQVYSPLAVLHTTGMFWLGSLVLTVPSYPRYPNGSLLHLFSVFRVTRLVVPSPAPYLTLHPAPTHALPLFPPFSLSSIYYCQNYFIFTIKGIVCFSLLFWRKRQRTGEHSAWHSDILVEEMGGEAGQRLYGGT